MRPCMVIERKVMHVTFNFAFVLLFFFITDIEKKKECNVNILHVC